eukprot:CCRYP_010522-RB/>CCRYP_010522-RB protein AED:0.41 eAED:0.41 QI:320/0.66/0.71/1/0.83/0.71/7/392/753
MDSEDYEPPEPIRALRKTMTRTFRNFDSAGEDQLLSDANAIPSDEDGENGNFDPPARERPAVEFRVSIVQSRLAFQDGKWPQRECLSFTRSLVFYGNGSITAEHEEAARYIEEARAMRKKYYGGHGVQSLLDTNKLSRHSSCNSGDYDAVGKGKTVTFDETCEKELDDKKPPATVSPTQLEYVLGEDGVVEVYESSDFRRTKNLVKVASLATFVDDYQRLVEMASSGAMRSFSFQRLQMLDSAFKMHVTINGASENEAKSDLLGTDFYRTMKIDNHIHLAAAATAKQFVDFVGDKLQNEGDTVVTEDGQTLKEVFEKAGLDSDHLTIDAFNVLADYSVYQRFDNFNSKYSPFRMAQMRKIFLKTDNHIDGRYFAELTKIVLARHEQRKGHTSAAEMRLSVYGMERNEWLLLAKWVLRDWEGGIYPGNMLSSRNRWLVQVPRLWRVFCKKGGGVSFQTMLENLFSPLFEATLHPEKHPEVAELLNNIVGIDSAPLTCEKPASWSQDDNPAYCWQLYHLWANIEVLNRVRKSKGLNTLAFRPHAGETGETMHLAATYMLCRSINHGINLDKQVSLQYLYYLDQVGLSISPLSNNFLFRKIRANPFPKLFKRGLNVTLSTDDPLLFHMSDDALLEEYSVARASFDLSMTDMSEIARNSVLQSGFEAHLKEEWLGKNFRKGMTHCDEDKTHVPLIRAKFRAEHLALEHLMVTLLAAGKGKMVLQQMMHQFGEARNGIRDILFSNMAEVPSFPEQNQL